MPLINYKVELKLKQMKHCALASNFSDDTDADPNKFNFSIKNTKLQVILSVNDDQKLSKLLSKEFE